MTLRIEDLKVGDELVCIDLEGYLSTSKGFLHVECMKNIINSKIVVSAVFRDQINIRDSSYYLKDYDFKYFKKKEQSQYTFDDLIDVAYKAYRDGIFNEISIDKSSFTTIGCIGWHQYFLRDHGVIRCHKGVDIVESIDLTVAFIQSLYKETFVIECEEDIARMIGGCDVTLSNGNKTIAESGIRTEGENKILLRDYKHPVGFFVLKGATVKQDRGRDD